MYQTESFHALEAIEADEGTLSMQFSAKHGQIVRASCRGLIMIATGLASGGLFWSLMLLLEYITPSCHPFTC
jgi:hypothetical protein